jgi:hypothetical protein
MLFNLNQKLVKHTIDLIANVGIAYLGNTEHLKSIPNGS